jgi:predicted  nucleic acid-binding Zn-ribbon protein
MMSPTTEFTQSEFNKLQTELGSFQKKLMTLEISLREASKRNLISSREYKKRYQQLVDTKRRLGDLGGFIAEPAALESGDSFVLPELNHCSLDELLICHHFIDERRAFLKEAYHHLEKLLGWVQDAAQGKGLGLKSILRLSHIKKILQRLDFEFSNIEYDEKAASGKSEALARNLAKKSQGPQLASNYHSFLKIFLEIDAILIRIARLKDAVSAEQGEIAQMENEMKRQELAAGAGLQHQPLDLEEIRRLHEQAMRQVIEPVEMGKKKLTIARNFIDSK